MSNYNYAGSGNATINGCYAAYKNINFRTKYAVGDVLYLKYKAQKGILESIFIRNVRILGGAFSFNQIVGIYTDNYNFIYNEDELLYLNEAIILKEKYCFPKSNYKHVSSVNINLNSCNGYENQLPITTRFKIGETVFLKYKAMIGILESISIKKVKILSELNCNFIKAIYLDNTNFYYNEYELVKEEEANLLMKDYVIEKILELEKNKINCNVKNIASKCSI